MAKHMLTVRLNGINGLTRGYRSSRLPQGPGYGVPGPQVGPSQALNEQVIAHSRPNPGHSITGF